MQEHHVAPGEGLHQMLGTLDSEADQVDHDVGLDCGNALAKRARGFFVNAVDRQSLDVRPRVVRRIWFPRAAAGGHDFMSSGDEARNEIGADVPSRAEYDDADG